MKTNRNSLMPPSIREAPPGFNLTHSFSFITESGIVEAAETNGSDTPTILFVSYMSFFFFLLQPISDRELTGFPRDLRVTTRKMKWLMSKSLAISTLGYIVCQNLKLDCHTFF